MKKFYFWHDAADPYQAAYTDLREEILYASKAAAKKDFKEYVVEYRGDDWTPVLRLYRVTVEKV